MVLTSTLTIETKQQWYS